MKDFGRTEYGAKIVMASCLDERCPPENILDGRDNTFWMTTGMFPQEFVIALDSAVQCSKITMLSLNVRKLSVERSEQDKPDTWDKVFEVELSNPGDRLQTEVHQVNIRAKFLRFSINSAYGEFVTVNRVSLVGTSEVSRASPGASLRNQQAASRFDSSYPTDSPSDGYGMAGAGVAAGAAGGVGAAMMFNDFGDDDPAPNNYGDSEPAPNNYGDPVMDTLQDAPEEARDPVPFNAQDDFSSSPTPYAADPAPYAEDPMPYAADPTSFNDDPTPFNDDPLPYNDDAGDHLPDADDLPDASEQQPDFSDPTPIRPGTKFDDEF